MNKEFHEVEEEEVTPFPFQGKISFTKALGIAFMIFGIVGAIGIAIVYSDISYVLRDELKGTYFAMGAGILLGNLAVGAILITLDRIATAVEKVAEDGAD